MGSDDNLDWNKSIRSILKSSNVKEVKKLRKELFLSLQLDESDKTAKKSFKRAVKNLEEEGKVTLDADGTITLKEKKKRKMDKDKKKKKMKKRKIEESGDN